MRCEPVQQTSDKMQRAQREETGNSPAYSCRRARQTKLTNAEVRVDLSTQFPQLEGAEQSEEILG